MTTAARAESKFVGMSAQKVRRMVELVRGRGADEALTMLKFVPNAAAKPVAKVLRTAIANAEENFGLNRGDLVVAEAFADEGPTRKWRRFGARGRFKPILRRSAHITIVVAEREGAKA
jgi:large subunit ribosomal protein L22